MKSFLLSSILYFFCVFTSFSQIPVGYLFDLDGNPFYGTYDVLTYSPIKQLKVIMTQDEYIKGKITYTNGVTEEEELLYTKGNVYTEHIGNYKNSQKKVSNKTIKSAVIGQDSLFTITRLRKFTLVKQQEVEYINNGVDLCLYIVQINDLEFANIIGGTKTKPTSSYIVKHTDSTVWESIDFSIKGRFNLFALKYFGHIPDLDSALSKKEYTNRSTPMLIKSLIYYEALKTGNPLYYDTYWNLEFTPEKAAYTAKVVSLKNGLWEVDYYKSNIKLSTLRFSELVPLTKDGLCTDYYPNGEIRNQIIFEENEIKNVSRFDSNGTKTNQYSKVVYDDFAIKFRNSFFIYHSRNPGIKSNQVDTFSYFDDHKNRVVYEKYEANKIKYSYFIEKGKKVYQYCDPTVNLKFSKIQEELYLDVRAIDFHKSIKKGAKGISLLIVRVNEKGKIASTMCIYAPTSSHKAYLKSFFTPGLSEVRKLGKYKINGKPVAYELVIPINFIKKSKIPNVRRDFYQEPNMFAPNYLPNYGNPGLR